METAYRLGEEWRELEGIVEEQMKARSHGRSEALSGKCKAVSVLNYVMKT
jgi:hypothetical protein